MQGLFLFVFMLLSLCLLHCLWHPKCLSRRASYSFSLYICLFVSGIVSGILSVFCAGPLIPLLCASVSSSLALSLSSRLLHPGPLVVFLCAFVFLSLGLSLASHWASCHLILCLCLQGPFSLCMDESMDEWMDWWFGQRVGDMKADSSFWTVFHRMWQWNIQAVEKTFLFWFIRKKMPLLPIRPPQASRTL